MCWWNTAHLFWIFRLPLQSHVTFFSSSFFFFFSLFFSFSFSHVEKSSQNNFLTINSSSLAAERKLHIQYSIVGGTGVKTASHIDFG